MLLRIQRRHAVSTVTSTLSQTLFRLSNNRNLNRSIVLFLEGEGDARLPKSPYLSIRKQHRTMARVELIMPKMGESIMEATILKWLKKPGDKVEQDESVLEVATDKVDTEVPSTHAGVLSEILAKGRGSNQSRKGHCDPYLRCCFREFHGSTCCALR